MTISTVTAGESSSSRGCARSESSPGVESLLAQIHAGHRHGAGALFDVDEHRTRTLQWVVGPEAQRSRLDHFCAADGCLGSRWSQVQRLIAEGLVRVGGRAGRRPARYCVSENASSSSDRRAGRAATEPEAHRPGSAVRG